MLILKLIYFENKNRQKEHVVKKAKQWYNKFVITVMVKLVDAQA